MTIRAGSLDRRTLLRGAIATAAMGSFAVACGSPSSKDNGGGGPKGKKGAKNPFGVAENSKVDAAIFDGGYGTDYVDYANNVIGKQVKGVKVQVKPVVDIAPELQPRFVGGNPPDLIDNSGEDQIGFLGILDQLEELDDVFEAKTLRRQEDRRHVYPGVKDPGTFKDKFVALNYVMTVYGVWYSKTLFEKNGWTPPKTWDEALDLGQKAKKKGKYLFVHGKEAATYYRTLLIDSAIKEGGDEVRIALENLEKDSWSHPAIQGVLKVMETMVKEKMFVPGGSGTQFQKAQAIWSNDQKALLYPSGGWIENEMKKATKDGLPDDRGPVDDAHRQAEDALRGASRGRRRAVHRAQAGQEPGRRQGSTAGDAVRGGGRQLLQDEAGPDDRQGHRARRRLRIVGAGLADEDARGRGRATSSPTTSSRPTG